jgi:cell division protein FtsA
LDNKALNGGIVLTGGGSQLKHLIQLTEYVTGLNARIGFPNEHLAAGHIEELSKPTYSTCIGLILKGYDDFEHNRKEFDKGYRKVDVPTTLRKTAAGEVVDTAEPETVSEVQMRKRRNLTGFWSKFKDRIIDLFKEEEDRHL